MYQHPFSAWVRLLPAILWLAAFAAVVRAVLGFFWNDLLAAWPAALVLFAFAAVGVYCLRQAYRAYKEALPALRADQPIRLGFPRRRPKPFVPTLYPLSETLRAELRQLIETLESAGMLLPGEVAIDELIDRTETFDEWSSVDLYLAMNVLHAQQHERKRPFANLAFFDADAEADQSAVRRIVEELARLCGRSRELRGIDVRSLGGGKIVPADSRSPRPNAVVKFELGAESHAVQFVLYAKLPPDGLVEALARILARPGDSRCLVLDYFDSFFVVSYLTPEQTSIVNGAEQQRIPRFAVVTSRGDGAVGTPAAGAPPISSA